VQATLIKIRVTSTATAPCSEYCVIAQLFFIQPLDSGWAKTHAPGLTCGPDGNIGRLNKNPKTKLVVC